MTENRRVRMTKRMIRDAYFELIIEDSARKLSVTEVCSRADVNRSTFYAHYKDIDSLYNEIEKDFFDRLPVLCPEGEPNYIEKNSIALRDFFVFIAQNPDLFTVLLANNAGRDWEFRISNILFKEFRPAGVERQNCVEYYEYIFCVMGALGATCEWHKAGFPVSPEIFGRLIFESCHKALTGSLGSRLAGK